MNDARWADHRIEVADSMADGDKVWALLGTSGRHIGEWLGLPATGKTWTNRVAMYSRVVNGKIIELILIPDQGNLAKQLGGVLSASPK